MFSSSLSVCMASCAKSLVPMCLMLFIFRHCSWRLLGVYVWRSSQLPSFVSVLSSGYRDSIQRGWADYCHATQWRCTCCDTMLGWLSTCCTFCIASRNLHDSMPRLFPALFTYCIKFCRYFDNTISKSAQSVFAQALTHQPIFVNFGILMLLKIFRKMAHN